MAKRPAKKSPPKKSPPRNSPKPPKKSPTAMRRASPTGEALGQVAKPRNSPKPPRKYPVRVPIGTRATAGPHAQNRKAKPITQADLDSFARRQGRQAKEEEKLMKTKKKKK